MRIVMPGGSGQVGMLLARAFHAAGDDVVVLSRRPVPAPWRVVAWDGVSDGPWMRELDGADVVVNLTGRSVNCRYTAANRQEILESRVRSTEAVGRAIAAAATPPRTWLQASTATIYAHSFDRANDEYTGRLGGQEGHAPPSWSFSIEVARAWEAALDAAATPGTRKVAMRSAITLSPDPEGIFDTLLGLVRHGLGGRASDGRQYLSWVHHEDFVAAVRWLIARPDLTGVVNIAAPNPLPNAHFMHALRVAAGVPVGLPAGPCLLELGAWLMRSETELMLKSRRVVPARLLDSGFRFRHPHWPEAAQALCDEWRARRRPAAA